MGGRNAKYDKGSGTATGKGSGSLNKKAGYATQYLIEDKTSSSSGSVGLEKAKLTNFENKLMEKNKIEIGVKPLKNGANGSYNPITNKITISPSSYNPVATFYHELGHSIELFGISVHAEAVLLSAKSQVEAIIRARQPSYDVLKNLPGAKKYIKYLTGRSEVFAEAYKAYKLSPKKLKEYAPSYFEEFEKLNKK